MEAKIICAESYRFEIRTSIRMFSFDRCNRIDVSFGARCVGSLSLRLAIAREYSLTQ